MRFGLPAIVAALAGAWVLVHLTDLPALATYVASGRTLHVTPVKLAVGILLAVALGLASGVL